MLLVLTFITSIPVTVFGNEQKLNMSYVYFGDTNSFIQQVNNTNGALQTVSPSYFDLKSDGSLHLKVDARFVQEMHKQNIKVVPFLSNHWDRELGRKALLNREKLAKQIADAIKTYNLDGVNVDIENVTRVDRDNYTDLVRQLRQLLPDKEVSVAVAANPNAWIEGWHGSYNYTELAKYSDYLMIMAYDESYYGSKPGPVASSSFVERSIQYALKQTTGDKIVLGIPFYGRYWRHESDKGGHGISANTVDVLIERYNGKVFFDEKSKSPYTTFTIHSWQPVTKLSNRTLEPGTYTVWYEDFRSIQHKVELVHKYNLKGTGSWSLNQAPKGIWDQYVTWLNGTYYDIRNHWANHDMKSMIDKGWMVGNQHTQFLPENKLTRAEAIAVLVRALGLKDKHLELYEHSKFADISNHWAKEEIELAFRFGLVEGIDDYTFAPKDLLTREQMATLLARVFDLENSQSGSNSLIEGVSNESIAISDAESTASTTNKTNVEVSQITQTLFPDLIFGHWSYSSVTAMAHKQIIQGYDDGFFHPKRNVTRAQFAAVMNRIAKDDATNKILVLK